MKRLLAVAAISLVLTGSALAAGVPTTEPELPSDLNTPVWKKTEGCRGTFKGKTILQTLYVRPGNDGNIVSFIVMTLNGKQVIQDRLYIIPDVGTHPSSATYIRNTPSGNWLKYKYDEEKDMAKEQAHLLRELGLSAEELAKVCAKKK